MTARCHTFLFILDSRGAALIRSAYYKEVISMTNHAQNMYQYNVWANRRIVDHLQTLSPDKYKQEIKSVFSSVGKVLSHIYLVETGWLKIKD
jgi:hypothetical protein